MKKVIEHKKAQVLSERVLSVRQYEKMKNVHQRPHTGKLGKRYLSKKYSFLRDQGGSVGNQ